jgi:dimethylhistidine N-methyltransferase
MAVQTNEAVAEPLQDDFAHAVLAGLAGARKHIPCRFLYDARGSELFEEITQLDEYYPTRTEIGLLESYGSEVAELAGEGCAVVEFGSGSSRKTHILLDHLAEPAAYVPIDIDAEALRAAAVRIHDEFPDIALHPVHADFNQEMVLPDAVADVPKLGFFPGSTIGNMEHDDAVEFLADAGALLGVGSDMLVGVDLRKGVDILLPAYDDASGVTATFVLNLVHRINRELGGNLDVASFAHRATYNEAARRVEIHIVSLADQEVEILGRRFRLAEGEAIHIENSHKYTLSQFRTMAREAGWRPEQAWTDDEELFSLHYLRREAS